MSEDCIGMAPFGFTPLYVSDGEFRVILSTSKDLLKTLPKGLMSSCSYYKQYNNIIQLKELYDREIQRMLSYV